MHLGADSMGIEPDARTIRLRTPPELTENSGAAMSAAQPGVWFTINDSGHEPVLFALDTTGAARGAWRIAGAGNRDWETLTTGPCLHGPASETANAGRRCVYIGEVGDNQARHPAVHIYRVTEPLLASRERGGELPATVLTVRYESGPRDVEAMVAGPDGTLYLISKRRLKDASGRLRPALIFAIPPQAWRRIADTAVARLVDSLPVVPGSALGRQITGASFARDGGAIAVRTYTQLYVFRADRTTGRIRTDVPPTICSVAGLEEKQGEGVTWFDGDSWMLTSEGRGEPAWVVECPAPSQP